MQVPSAPSAPSAASSETTTVAIVGHTAPSPTVAVGVDWAVLIPIIATGLGLLITTSVNALLSYHNGKKADAIHVLVNSGMTKALADNAAQAEEIRTLRSLVQSLNDRVSGMPAATGKTMPTVHPSAAEVVQAQAVVDAGRLPSVEVQAAQDSTPVVPPPSPKTV